MFVDSASRLCASKASTLSSSFPFLLLFILHNKRIPTASPLPSLNPLIKTQAKITSHPSSIYLKAAILVILQNTPPYLPLRPHNPPQILQPKPLFLLRMGHLDQQYVKILPVGLVDLLTGAIQSLIVDSVLLVYHREVGQ